METKANYVLIGAFTSWRRCSCCCFGLWAAKYLLRPQLAGVRGGLQRAGHRPDRGQQVQYNGIARRHDRQPEPGARRSAPGDRALKLKSDTPVKIDTRAKLSHHQPHRHALHPAHRRQPGSALLEPRSTTRSRSSAPRPRRCRTSPTPPTAWSRAWTRCSARTTSPSINATLDNLEQATGSISDQREDIAALIVNARKTTEHLQTHPEDHQRLAQEDRPRTWSTSCRP